MDVGNKIPQDLTSDLKVRIDTGILNDFKI